MFLIKTFYSSLLCNMQSSSWGQGRFCSRDSKLRIRMLTFETPNLYHRHPATSVKNYFLCRFLKWCWPSIFIMGILLISFIIHYVACTGPRKGKLGEFYTRAALSLSVGSETWMVHCVTSLNVTVIYGWGWDSRYPPWLVCIILIVCQG